MDINERVNEYIKDNYGKQTNKELCKMIEREFGVQIKELALRKRHGRMMKGVDKIMNNTPKQEYERFLPNGEKELLKIIYLTPSQKESPAEVLKALGYDPQHWTIADLILNTWQQNSVEKGITDLYQVKVRLKPLVKNLSVEDVISATKEVMKETITPRKFATKTVDNKLNDKKLLEFPAVELHLGKMAHNWDTGEDYDQKIAQDRFNEIIEAVVDEQLTQKCGTLFMYIGQDFFNSDTVDNTTTRGTPQQNDLRWKKMFKVGLELYIEAILTLRERFNKVDVQLNQGNHDVMASFYLYIALQQYFINDPKVNFSDNYKTTQCYLFGKCAIFTNHGDNNYKRLVESIPVEFPMEWATATYRELHLGHLHSEHAEEKSGLLTRRIGSPSGTDDWHYQQRYLGAIPKHQLFIWDADSGLQHIRYINFDKKKIKIKEISNKV